MVFQIYREHESDPQNASPEVEIADFPLTHEVSNQKFRLVAFSDSVQVWYFVSYIRKPNDKFWFVNQQLIKEYSSIKSPDLQKIVD